MSKEEIIRDYNYSDSVCYKEVLDTYNALIGEDKQSDAKRLIGEHGGIIAVLVKHNYQIGNF
jgi:hypothetical protein